MTGDMKDPEALHAATSPDTEDGMVICKLVA